MAKVIAFLESHKEIFVKETLLTRLPQDDSYGTVK